MTSTAPRYDDLKDPMVRLIIMEYPRDDILDMIEVHTGDRPYRLGKLDAAIVLARHVKEGTTP